MAPKKALLKRPFIIKLFLYFEERFRSLVMYFSLNRFCSNFIKRFFFLVKKVLDNYVFLVIFTRGCAKSIIEFSVEKGLEGGRNIA